MFTLYVIFVLHCKPPKNFCEKPRQMLFLFKCGLCILHKMYYFNIIRVVFMEMWLRLGLLGSVCTWFRKRWKVMDCSPHIEVFHHTFSGLVSLLLEDNGKSGAQGLWANSSTSSFIPQLSFRTPFFVSLIGDIGLE